MGPDGRPHEQCGARASGTTLLWRHFDAARPDTPERLSRLGLPPLVVNALVAGETRPRTDLLDGGAIINLRGLDEHEEGAPDLLSSVRLWVTEGEVVSTTMRDLSALAALDRAFAAHEINDSGDVICILASAITAELDPDVAELGDALDDAEGALSGANALALRGVIARVRSRAIAYRRFLQPQRVALERLATMEAMWLADDDRQHLREAADRGARMAEELEAIRERAALMHEQLTDLRAELLDTRSLILAIAAMIFLPLTFITGLFGMNVDGIPYQHHPQSFWVITGLCLLIAVAVTAYFVWKRWSR